MLNEMKDSAAPPAFDFNLTVWALSVVTRDWSHTHTHTSTYTSMVSAWTSSGVARKLATQEKKR